MENMRTRSYLVVLDGEQNETVRVLLQYGLGSLLLFECGCNLWLFCGRVLHQRNTLDWDGHLAGLVAAVEDVLLVCLCAEKRLLDRGLHLEALNGGCGLERELAVLFRGFQASTS